MVGKVVFGQPNGLITQLFGPKHLFEGVLIVLLLLTRLW